MGGKNSKPPDYGPVAEASEEAAQIMANLGREQLSFAREQYNDVSPFLENIANTQVDAQNQQMEQAQDYYDYQQSTFRPVEQRIVDRAQEYDSNAARERLASQAAADAGLAFNTNRQANERAMASMGVNPNSGRFAGVQAASGLSQAANRAAAMTNTRTQADQVGQARMLDAAGLGRNLPGASSAAYSGAAQSGALAGDARQSPGQNYAQNFSAGAQTIGSGQNARIQGLSNVLNAQTTYAINDNNSVLGDLGGLAGGAAGIMAAWPSDRRLKENIREVAVDQRTALPLYEFNYIGEETKYIGVMADDVMLMYPDAVVFGPDGFQRVNYDMLGIEMKEVL